MEPSTTAPATEGIRRVSVAHFLIALVLLLVTAPFVEQIPNGDIIETALITLVLLSAVMAVGGRRRTFIAAALLVIPAIVGTWMHHFQPDVMPRFLSLVAAIVFTGYVALHLLGFIMRAPKVNAEVLCAAVSIYLMLGILWAFSFELMAQLLPGAFVGPGDAAAHHPMTGFDSLYFSFGTLTGADTGDIKAAVSGARMLVMVEATAGMLFVAVLIARLVGLYSTSKPATH